MKKDLVIAVLATFCVTATLFIIIPTRSQNDRYDPWLDVNGDGKMDILDIAAVAKAFASSGDSTKNVNVTNWPSPKTEYELLYLGKFNITSGKAYYFDIPDWNNPVFCGGYSRLSVSYDVSSTNAGSYDLTLSLAGISWFVSKAVTLTLERVYLLNTTITAQGFTKPEPALIVTKAPYFSLEFRTDTSAPNWQNIWIAIDVYVYLRSE